MYQPNATASLFCQWLLDNTWLHFSNPQRNLITLIQTAADDVTPVTPTQWKNFLMLTNSRYSIYLQAIALLV